jgi:hypothetical protein
MNAMTPELFPPLILALFIAIVFVAVELRNSMQPPVCSQCAHCRMRAIEKQREEERVEQWQTRTWGMKDGEDDKHPRR